MKTIAYFLALILLVPFVAAGPVAYGYVILDIVNNPPEITSLELDSEFDCNGIVMDENPATVSVTKKWYANGELVEKSSIKYGDNVICELVPVDDAGQEGATYSLSFEMPKPKMFLPLSQNVF